MSSKSSSNSSSSCTKRGEKHQSKFRGVAKHKDGNWEAHIWYNQKQLYLGIYVEEEKAARAHDKAALKIYKEKADLNYPVVNYIHDIERLGRMSMKEMLAEMKRDSKGFARGSSEYRGVSWRANTKHWEARIGRLLGRKYTYLGTYQTAEEAARAYDRAALSMDGRAAITNFPKSDYEERIKEVENASESEKLKMQQAIANRTHEWTVKGVVSRSRPTNPAGLVRKKSFKRTRSDSYVLQGKAKLVVDHSDDVCVEYEGRVRGVGNESERAIAARAKRGARRAQLRRVRSGSVAGSERRNSTINVGRIGQVDLQIDDMLSEPCGVDGGRSDDASSQGFSGFTAFSAPMPLDIDPLFHPHNTNMHRPEMAQTMPQLMTAMHADGGHGPPHEVIVQEQAQQPDMEMVQHSHLDVSEPHEDIFGHSGGQNTNDAKAAATAAAAAAAAVAAATATAMAMNNTSSATAIASDIATREMDDEWLFTVERRIATMGSVEGREPERGARDDGSEAMWQQQQQQQQQRYQHVTPSENPSAMHATATEYYDENYSYGRMDGALSGRGGGDEGTYAFAKVVPSAPMSNQIVFGMSGGSRCEPMHAIASHSLNAKTGFFNEVKATFDEFEMIHSLFEKAELIPSSIT